MDLLLLANLLRRRTVRPAGGFAEDEYYLTYAPAPSMVVRIAPLAVIGVILALVIDVWWH